jgi:hypothetical protein
MTAESEALPFGRYFFVPHGDVFDVIWPGGDRLGDSAKERTRNHYPRLVATCETKQDAELVCDALDAFCGGDPQ